MHATAHGHYKNQDERWPLLSGGSVRFTGHYALATIAVMLVVVLLSSTRDYVGADNDDVMRLVQVRDLLAGQGWFDLTQYRLGMEGGTLMHWSRLVDLPIAFMIRIGEMFLPHEQAEALALTVWPLMLIPLLLYPLGIAAGRLSGSLAMHVALGLGSLFAFTCVRFHPGSIDHHNAQMVLVAWVAAMIIDPQRRLTSYAAAGVAAALAVAIGAETVPLVAAACLGVAFQWVWHGEVMAQPARTFGIVFTLSISAIFFVTVPPQGYGVVTCDSLSLGFYSLSAMGGALLAAVTCVPFTSDRRTRIVAAAAIGTVLFIAARVIAPQCLGSPLANLDPMLVKLWLNMVNEAQPFATLILREPYALGGYYAVGFFAIMVCLFRAVQGVRRETHLVLGLLAVVCWGIALVQVRGFIFANLVAILPLSLLIADLRNNWRADPESPNRAFAYLGTVLISVPVVWGVAGALLDREAEAATSLVAITQDSNIGPERGECSTIGGLPLLAAMEPGVVVAPSNSGAEILRFTPHRVLTAPYHRNQAGMLTELHIGLAQPDEARAFLEGADATIIAFCASDPQTQSLARMKADGLYALLSDGRVPSFLLPAGSEGGFRFYRFVP